MGGGDGGGGGEKGGGGDGDGGGGDGSGGGGGGEGDGADGGAIEQQQLNPSEPSSSAVPSVPDPGGQAHFDVQSQPVSA